MTRVLIHNKHNGAKGEEPLKKLKNKFGGVMYKLHDIVRFQIFSLISKFIWLERTVEEQHLVAPHVVWS